MIDLVLYVYELHGLKGKVRQRSTVDFIIFGAPLASDLCVSPLWVYFFRSFDPRRYEKQLGMYFVFE